MRLLWEGTVGHLFTIRTATDKRKNPRTVKTALSKVESYKKIIEGEEILPTQMHFFLLFPHLHSSLSIMHTQPFRALIDAWMSRLFPWLHWDPIHFSVFPNAGLKPKHVQSGVAVLQGQSDQEKKIYQFYKRGGCNVYPGNFRLPVSPSSGSDSHLGVMHISFRAEDCLLHNV